MQIKHNRSTAKELDMTEGYRCIENDAGRKPAALRDIFDWYIGETITDEQVYRVLKPVLEMIKEGKFDNSYRKRLS